MMIALTLALSLLAQPQRRPPPPPPPIDVAAVAEHAARLAVLEHRKQELEADLLEGRREFGYGESHPQLVVLRAKLAAVDKALLAESAAWRENEIDRLLDLRSDLQEQRATAQSQGALGPNHPTMRALGADIADVTAKLAERSKALLAAGLEQALLADAGKKDAPNLDAFLRLAKLYAASDRTADAERMLTDAIALLRARGK
jgi:uncharacterized protein involved in exopolysaccharide biosynthesis